MPAITATRPRIVDADGHVLEHPTAMLEYMPERYKKRCFHVETDADGSEWCFHDDLKNANFLALAGAGGMTLEERERARKGEIVIRTSARARSTPRSGSPRWRRTTSSRRSSTRPCSSASPAPTSTSPRPRRAPTTTGSPTTARRAHAAVRHRGRVQTDVDRCIRIAEDARKLGLVGVFLRPNPNQEGSCSATRPTIGSGRRSRTST